MKLLVVDKVIFPVDVEASTGVEVTRGEHDTIVEDWNLGIAHTNRNDITETAPIEYADRVAVFDKARKTNAVKAIDKKAKEKLEKHYPDLVASVSPETQDDTIDTGSGSLDNSNNAGGKVQA